MVVQTNCRLCHGKLRAAPVKDGFIFFCFNLDCRMCSLPSTSYEAVIEANKPAVRWTGRSND